eukprot:364493-Chlamydomonas_euryale.AAC.12
MPEAAVPVESYGIDLERVAAAIESCLFQADSRSPCGTVARALRVGRNYSSRPCVHNASFPPPPCALLTRAGVCMHGVQASVQQAPSSVAKVQKLLQPNKGGRTVTYNPY